MDSTTSYIQQNISKNDLFCYFWTEIFQLYTKKLWHQLTLAIEKMVNNNEFRNSVDLKLLYDSLISNFENKINCLALARISIIIGQQMLENSDANSAILFLNKILTKVSGLNSNEANVLIMTSVGIINLISQNDLIQAREVIEKIDKLLNEIDGVTSAHAPFYKLSSIYYSSMGNFGAFYREALKYLSCLDKQQMDDLSLNDKEEWAVKLCISALLGRNIYNFGELLMHDIVNYIGDSNRYLLELVYGFNEGSMEKVMSMQSQMMTQSDLTKEVLFLEEKITLMCLVEMIFQRPVNHRTVTFTEVASSTNVKVESVELLVMKAMSKGLIKGRIDEVNQKVIVKWVQPRVLNLKQIESIQANIVSWSKSVGDMGDLINVNAVEILN